MRALSRSSLYASEQENGTIAYKHMRIILTIHLCVLSHTSVYAFAESPGVRVCHADYALGPTTLLCNAMQCNVRCNVYKLHYFVRIVILENTCLSVCPSRKDPDRCQHIRNYQSAKDADANKHHV